MRGRAGGEGRVAGIVWTAGGGERWCSEGWVVITGAGKSCWLLLEARV